MRIRRKNIIFTYNLLETCAKIDNFCYIFNRGDAHDR